MELYRGKSIKSGKWIVGQLIFFEEKPYMLITESPFAERPSYNRMAMGCGLEDRGLQNSGYDAMAYGWEEALERYEESFPEWEELVPETVTRCTNKHDMANNVLFEGDVIKNPDNLLFEISYGRYLAYCPADNDYMENVGFFTVSKDVEDMYKIDYPMPMGETEGYSLLVGNVFDNPELSQYREDEKNPGRQYSETPSGK